MKRFLFFIASFLLLFNIQDVSAASLTFTPKSNTIDFVFSVETNGPLAPNQYNGSSFELILYKGQFPQGAYSQNHSTQSVLGNNPLFGKKTLDTNGQIKWSVEVSPSTTYTARIAEFKSSSPINGTYITNPQTIVTTNPTVVPGKVEFSFQKNVSSTKVTGTFDLQTNPNAKDYTVQFQWSRVPMGSENSLNALKFEDFTNNTPPKIIAYKGHGNSSEMGVDNEGKYNLIIPNLTPSTRYNIRETISYGGYSITKDYIHTVGESNVLDTPEKIEDDFEKRSYRLLSPLPGFTVFMDPDLCAEQTAAGNTNQICDINDILNLGLEILIGIAAVLLVFRIIFEGYRLITSDIPFMKVEAKGKLWDALFGLLLILFSYVLLNTINPRLVSGMFKIDTVGISIEGDKELPVLISNSTPIHGSIYCPMSGGRNEIKRIAESFNNRTTYNLANGKSIENRSDGTVHLDCSGYVNAVLTCAGFKPGVDFINSGTANIFSNAESVNMKNAFTINGTNVIVNGKILNSGDLIGWPPSGGNAGHVFLYIGGGVFIDTHGPSGKVGKAISTWSAERLKSRYESRIKNVKRLSV